MTALKRLLALVVAVAVVALLWLYVPIASSEGTSPGIKAPYRAHENAESSPGTELALALLRRVARGDETLAYKATQVIILWSGRGAKANIARVVRDGTSRVRIEYLPSASSPYQLVICDGNKTWSYVPSKKLAVVQRFNLRLRGPQLPGDEFSQQNLDLLQRNYDVRLLGQALVASREAYSILLLPRHSGNPERRVWIDSQKPLVLRVEEYNSRGELMFLSYYAQITFLADIPDSMFEFAPPEGTRVLAEPDLPELVPPHALRAALGGDILIPSFSAEGYVLEGGAIARLGDMECIHLQYFDGLGTVSFFQAVLPTRSQARLKDAITVEVNETRADLVQRPRTNILRWRVGGRDFFLVGNVDGDTMIKMAESVCAQGKENSQEGIFGSLTERLFLLFFRR